MERLRVKYNFYPIEGYLSKTTASAVYGAIRRKEINAFPEFAPYLYSILKGEAGTSRGMALQRYNQNWFFYDKMNELTLYILNKDFSKAQVLVDEVQDRLIQQASKKSPFFKYFRKKETNENIESLYDLLSDLGWEEKTFSEDHLYFTSSDEYYSISAYADSGIRILIDRIAEWEGSFEDFYEKVRIKGDSVFVKGKLL